MRAHSPCAVLVAALLALAPTLTAANSPTADAAPAATSQPGQLTLNGCSAQARDIVLTATPMVVAGVPRPPTETAPPGGPDPARLPAHRAQVRATADPNVFAYVFRGLKAGQLYTLDAQLPVGLCPKVTWVGPTRGVFAAGQQASLDLAGYALTTRIEVQSPGVDGQPEVYRASDFVALQDATRRFRWVSDLPGVTDFELQVAAERFTPATETPDTCGSPNKLLWRQVLKGGLGSNLTPPLDFGSLLQNEGAVLADDSGQAPGEQVATVTESMRAAIEAGMPLYVRVIPLRADGLRLCDLLRHGAAAHSAISFLRKPVGIYVGNQALIASGEYVPPRPPAPYDYCVSAVRPYQFVPTPFDPYAWEFFKLGLAVPVPNTALLEIPEGAAFCGDRSTSVFDDVGDFFSGFVDAIAQVVNFVADLYNSIKEEVIVFAAQAVEFAGIDCAPETFCRDALDYAMTTALAAAGLPPSLPDFDALVNDGIDYVAGYVAKQVASQVPVPFAEDGTKKVVTGLVNEVRSARGGGGGLPSWLTYDNGFRPAQLTVDASVNILDPLPATALRVSSAPGLFRDMTLPIAPDQFGFRAAIALPPDVPPAPPCINVGSYCVPVAPEVVLKQQLQGWYDTRIQARCDRLVFNALRAVGQFGSLQPLSSHTLWMDAAASLPIGGSSACQP